VSYDRIDWHLDSAVEAGQPEERAFAHIGLYLAWLIRHDLHDPRFLPDDHVEAVKRGEMTGSDLADDIDGKLIGDVMSDEGRSFSDARYEAYLGHYAKLFGDLPEYGLEDGPEAYDKVEKLLDRLYVEWVDGGRQAPPPRADPPPIDLPPGSSMVALTPGLRPDQLEELLAGLQGDVEVVDSAMFGARSHVAPDLEALIPSDLASPHLEIESDSAATWGSSLLTRALKRLGVSSKDAVVVHAIGGEGEGTLTATIYGVPGIDPDRLASEFRSVIFRLPGSDWEMQTIDGREVHRATGKEFTVVFWARDGMVIHVTGQPEVVIPAISRLP
jgi:hypothetical protein